MLKILLKYEYVNLAKIKNHKILILILFYVIEVNSFSLKLGLENLAKK